MSLSHRINHVFYLMFTMGFYLMYSIKAIFTQAISYLLMIILGTTVVSSDTGGGRAYFSLGLIIIVSLMTGEYIRKDSWILNIISKVIGPIDKGGIDEVVPRYTWYKHFGLMFFLFMLDVLKILAGVYCVVYLFVVTKTGIFLNIAVLCMLFFESLVAMPIYIIFCVGLLYDHKFFVKWLRWMCNRYISKIMSYEVKLKDNVLHLNTTKKEKDESESSTPQIFNDLRLNTSDESGEVKEVIIINPQNINIENKN